MRENQSASVAEEMPRDASDELPLLNPAPTKEDVTDEQSLVPTQNDKKNGQSPVPTKEDKKNEQPCAEESVNHQKAASSSAISSGLGKENSDAPPETNGKESCTQTPEVTNPMVIRDEDLEKTLEAHMDVDPIIPDPCAVPRSEAARETGDEGPLVKATKPMNIPPLDTVAVDKDVEMIPTIDLDKHDQLDDKKTDATAAEGGHPFSHMFYLCIHSISVHMFSLNIFRACLFFMFCS